MRLAISLLITAGLLWLAVFLCEQAKTAENPFLYFGGAVLLGIVAGTVVVLTLLPRLGDGIGSAFFVPNEPIEKNPHADALAAIARGDYARAIDEYEKAYSKNPSDTHALSEMARLYCEKLHDPAPAAELLESGLDHDLPPEDAAFLSARLAEVYWNYQRDGVKARALLTQVIELMPNTRHSANAAHRLQEIERILVSS